MIDTQEIEVGWTALYSQAEGTVGDVLTRMMTLFNDHFGEGQAKKHPALVIELVHLTLYEARTGVEGVGVQKIRNAIEAVANAVLER